ncbi:unnamed protein product [Prorocentrum cordatum]|uniref:Uncharacterized protein n=1 Tax=Prorocentrum cordatum TaxID=2364126 RepID=A0ABN9QD05_9DINO|nr:unnamed protein product [Polarella glacialis]
MKHLVQVLALMLLARDALAGGFGLGDIGKAVEAVSKDHPNVRGIVEEKVRLAAADPQKVAGDASKGVHVLKKVDTTKATDAVADASKGAQVLNVVDSTKAKDAVASAAQSAPVNSQSVAGDVIGSSKAATRLQQLVGSTKASAAPGEEAFGEGAVHGPPSVAEKSLKAAQHTLGELLQQGVVQEAVSEVTSSKAAEVIARAEPNGIEGAASRFADSPPAKLAQAAQDAGAKGIHGAVSASVGPSSEVSQALGRAAGSEVPGVVRRPAQQAAQDLQRLAGSASMGGQSLAGAGAIVDAARSAPAVSAAVGELPGATEGYGEAAQGALAAALQDKSAAVAVAEITPRWAADAIAKAGDGRIGDAASRFARNDETIAEAARDAGVNGIVAEVGTAEPGLAVDQAVEKAVVALETEEGIAGAVAEKHFGSLVDKTKANGVKELVMLAGTDSAKQDIVAAKTATWQDLAGAVGGARKEHLESAIASSERAVRSIAKSNFLEPVGENVVEGEPRRRGVGVNSGLLVSIAFAGVLCICFSGMKQFSDTRSSGMSMLGDDSEQDCGVLASRWVNPSARDIVSSTHGRNPAACSPSFGQAA